MLLRDNCSFGISRQLTTLSSFFFTSFHFSTSSFVIDVCASTVDIMSTLNNRMRTFNCSTRLSRRENDFLVKGGTAHNSFFHSFVPIHDHGSPIDVDPTKEDLNTRTRIRQDTQHLLQRIALNVVHTTISLHTALVKFLSHYDSTAADFIARTIYILYFKCIGLWTREKGMIRLFFPPLLLVTMHAGHANTIW